MDSSDTRQDQHDKLRAEEKRVYYDKAVLGNAAVFGIIADLHLSQTIDGVTSTKRYSTATAAFYWGYIVAVLPFALLFARLPLARTAAVLVLVWGVTCILTVVCTSFSGFVAQRFFLGLAESAVSPAFVAVTALWYKPYEQATRMGIWYSATGLFSMISGLINYGIGHNHLAHKWHAMYYFCGSVTIAWSSVIWFFMPTSPLQPGRFFNERERAVLLRRFEENPYGKDRLPFKLDQFIEAITDIKTLLYFLMGTAIYICNGSVTAFGARIIASFGYDSLTTTALLIPGGAMTVVTIVIFSTIADRYRDSRTLVLPVSCIPVVVGALVVWLAPWHPTAGPLIGYYLVASFGAPYVLLLTIAASNVTGATKKAVTSGAIFIGYNVGNIASAYLVFTQEAKVKYRSTWISVIVGMVVASLCSLVLRLIFIHENARRDALARHTPAPPAPLTRPQAGAAEKAAGFEGDGHGSDAHLTHEEKIESYEDKTDKQRPEFRYSL